MFYSKVLLFFLIFLVPLVAADKPNDAPPPLAQAEEEPSLEEHPWLTGPLFSPSAVTIPKGHANYEPYLFVNNNIAYWNNHWKIQGAKQVDNVNLQIALQFGLNDFMDITIGPQGYYSYVGNQDSFEFGDLLVGLGFQLCREGKKWYEAAVKLAIKELFPTGKYSGLNPLKNGTDSAGGGSFQSGLAFTFAKLYHLCEEHFLATRLNFTVTIPSSVKVSGFNTYGGGYGTSGRVQPGTTLLAILGLEYTLNQHWALALDLQNLYSTKTFFSGSAGTTTDGGAIAATTGHPTANVFSVAPAIEYNYNANVGVIAGAWVGIAGRNTPQFASAVVAVNIYV